MYEKELKSEEILIFICNCINNSICKIPAAKPPSVVGNCTVRHNCKANCVFPVLAAP